MPTISDENITPGGSATTVIRYAATFNVNVHAVTGNLTLGLPNSGNPAFAANPNLTAIYKNGVQDTFSNYAPVVSYSQPNGTVLSGDGTSFTIGQGQTVTIPVTYSFIVKGASANTYAVQSQGIESSLGLINSMAGQPIWRTNSI